MISRPRIFAQRPSSSNRPGLGEEQEGESLGGVPTSDSSTFLARFPALYRARAAVFFSAHSSKRSTYGGLGLLLAVREELLTDSVSKIKRTFWLEPMIGRLTPRWGLVPFLLRVLSSARD